MCTMDIQSENLGCARNHCVEKMLTSGKAAHRLGGRCHVIRKPGYGEPSGALIEITTGYKLIVGSQNSAVDLLNWDARDYPCGMFDGITGILSTVSSSY
eukprot:m.517551 g.517551  ORF g.517551 m.517551 type:complete len:99 (-) comp21935_c0_seq42:353-649(-)